MFGGVIRRILNLTSFDSATNAWETAVNANGGSVSDSRKTAVNNLIAGLKSDGVWSNLDRLWLLAAENEPSALTSIVNPLSAIAVKQGSPAFAIDRGYTGVDASTTIYIDTKVSLSSFGGIFTQHAGHISAWSNTETISSASGGVIVGASDTNPTYILPRYNDGNVYFNCNGNTSANITISSSLGHYLANRSNATTLDGYVNGVDMASTNVIDQGIPAPNGTGRIIVGCPVFAELNLD